MRYMSAMYMRHTSSTCRQGCMMLRTISPCLSSRRMRSSVKTSCFFGSSSTSLTAVLSTAGTTAARYSRSPAYCFALYSPSVAVQVFLDYSHVLTRLPQLRDRLIETDGALDAGELSELEQLSRSVPKLVSIIPDVLPDRTNIRHTAAAAEMTNQLVRHLDQIRPLAIVSHHFPYSFIRTRGRAAFASVLSADVV